MAFWLDIAAFALKALLLVLAVGGLVCIIARLTRGVAEDDSEIRIESLNERYQGAQEGRQDAAAGQAYLCPRLQGRHQRERGDAARS